MKIGVIGATGLVGRLVVSYLEARSQLAPEVVALASAAGPKITFRGGELDVCKAADFDFSRLELVLTSTPDDVARLLVPRVLAAGCRVVDESAAFRRHEEAVLAVCGVNEHRIDSSTRLVAAPNCTTTQIALALAPLHRAFGIEEVVVSTYQAASGAGRAGIEALHRGDEELFGRRLAGDLIPSIGSNRDGSTSEEEKLVWELPHLLEADFPVHATCVRVPVDVGHGASIWVRFHTRPIDSPAVLEGAFGVRVVTGSPGPRAVAGSDDVLVARIRAAGERALSLWCLGDNLRVGAALNAVRLADLMLSSAETFA